MGNEFNPMENNQIIGNEFNPMGNNIMRTNPIINNQMRGNEFNPMGNNPMMGNEFNLMGNNPIGNNPMINNPMIANNYNQLLMGKNNDEFNFPVKQNSTKHNYLNGSDIATKQISSKENQNIQNPIKTHLNMPNKNNDNINADYLNNIKELSQI
jgi:hypothetical protein